MDIARDMQLESVFALGEGASATGSTVQRIYESLRQRIITLDLLPNATLTRSYLTGTYGVSQTPIREALQRLARDGLVRIHPQSKTVVTRIDVPAIHESHFLRVALETEVARRLAQGCPPSVVTQARSIIRMQEAISGDRDQLRLFQDLDEKFHQTLFVGLGRGGLHQLVCERSGHLERIRRIHLPEKGKVVSIIENHHTIIEAIARGNETGAVDAMREHLSRTVARVEELRHQYPDYFD